MTKYILLCTVGDIVGRDQSRTSLKVHNSDSLFRPPKLIKLLITIKTGVKQGIKKRAKSDSYFTLKKVQ
jgi:hypothetical protein